jgi:hypothetical protein
MVHGSRRGCASTILVVVRFGTIAAGCHIVHLTHGLTRCSVTSIHRGVIDAIAIRHAANAIQVAISSAIFRTTIRHDAAVGSFIPQTVRQPIFLQRRRTLRAIGDGTTAGGTLAFRGTECGDVVGVVRNGGGAVAGHPRHVITRIHTHSGHPSAGIGGFTPTTTVLQTIFASGGIEQAVSHGCRRRGSIDDGGRGGGFGASGTREAPTFCKGTDASATSTRGLVPSAGRGTVELDRGQTGRAIGHHGTDLVIGLVRCDAITNRVRRFPDKKLVRVAGGIGKCGAGFVTGAVGKPSTPAGETVEAGGRRARHCARCGGGSYLGGHCER